MYVFMFVLVYTKYVHAITHEYIYANLHKNTMNLTHTQTDEHIYIQTYTYIHIALANITKSTNSAGHTNSFLGFIAIYIAPFYTYIRALWCPNVQINTCTVNYLVRNNNLYHKTQDVDANSKLTAADISRIIAKHWTKNTRNAYFSKTHCQVPSK